MRWNAIAWALVGAASAASAQGMEIGVKGGLSVAEFSGGDNEFDQQEGSRKGLVAGAFLAFPLGGPLSLQPEALFAQKGTGYEFTDLDTTIKLDYVEVPLLLKARFGVGVRPYVFAGPYVGFRLSAKADAAGDDGPDGIDLEDETKGTDYGFVGGAGLEIGMFLVEGRYARGLGGIASDEIEDDIDNAVWSVLVGLRF
jgi:outer membrane protein with beta-barrel domain